MLDPIDSLSINHVFGIKSSHILHIFLSKLRKALHDEAEGNTTELEIALESILGGICVVYSSGMAASFATLLLCRPKKIWLVPGYFGTTQAMRLISSVAHIEIIKLEKDPGTPELQAACTSEYFTEVPPNMLWIESPVNPTGEIIDLQRHLACICKTYNLSRREIIVICDATLAPPPLSFPFDFGADIVIHSATKILGGHSDLLAGIVALQSPTLSKKLQKQRSTLGTSLADFEAKLLMESLSTAQIRIKQQSSTCTQLVEWLSKSPHPELPTGVMKNVIHGSLQTLMPTQKKQVSLGHAYVFSIIFETQEIARCIPYEFDIIKSATSLGGGQTLMEWRYEIDLEQDPKLCRVTVGIESLEALKQDFIKTFAKLSSSFKK
ncbi:hypothetical protein DSO57_1023105 [Entomophthora muscae]|uniref:Uncharacterized protein n=1 Tax=Entomophthora muscae TaxID=34485 RepID=A0ACC2U204_9FUNG|nr:hypothetical protein DSO57_1023105 [Entomophthora muscae]